MFRDVACDAVLCVCVWGSLHNELEPDWWLAGGGGDVPCSSGMGREVHVKS